MNSANTVPTAENAAKKLVELYRSRGYKHYRMSKFEEYDFYAKNKNFLVSNNIITFTDLAGKLMALKPDVTLSIVKNARWGKGSAEKVYYTEKVYRPEKGAHEFREITQTGLECVGDLGFYDIAEVITLAVMSLGSIHSDYILDLSHMGFVTGLLSHIGMKETAQHDILSAISEKNVPAVRRICMENGISEENREKLMQLTGLYGSLGDTLEELKSLSVNDRTDAAVAELECLYSVLKTADLHYNVHMDFSIVNDMNYYNGIIFRGYIKGIPQGVLSGGSYDSLLAKMGRKANALGFAIYLDLLDQLRPTERTKDADILITYAKDVPVDRIMQEAEKYYAQGLSVRVQKIDDGSVFVERKIRLTNNEGGTTDGNA